MKIAFCGAQGTGKTTLVNELSKLEMFKYYEIDTGSTRWVKELGLDLNKGSTILTQELVLLKKLGILYTYDKLIADRTTIDVMAYTNLVLKRNSHKATPDEETLKRYMYHLDMFQKSLNEYDLIFYVKPEFELIGDNVRSADVEFQQEVAEEIDKLIKITNINVATLAGSVEERVKQILHYVEISV